MEEIDSIIIDSLRNLHCDLDETVTSLKNFDPDMILCAISRCLETILPETNFPKKLPPSMSLKLKITSSLASQIKDLGFRDDIGYQTILYCNESEIRRVLMFLIEKLPREANKTINLEQTGYVANLQKQIEMKVRNSLQQFWVPSSILENGYKHYDGLIFYSLGHCKPLRTIPLKVPSQQIQNENFKEFWIRNVPVITQQSHKLLLPSLLFQDCLINDRSLTNILQIAPKEEVQEILQHPHKLVEISQDHRNETESEYETKLNKLIENLKIKKSECLETETNIKSVKSQIEQIQKNKIDEEEHLQKILTQINLKSKTLTVLSKEENLQKLKKMIEASKNKLLNLTEQWNNIQAPLLEEYNSLQNAISDKDLEQQKQREKLKKLEETYKKLTTDLQEKTQLEEQLKLKFEQINKNHSRSGYTRRILEIIGNIKKQDEEIQKILKDTREVQREISILTGQVDRSFTLADELIFRDARNDETARKAYKLLAHLRDDCTNIIKFVTDLGSVERECRNLQEQIDSESAKETLGKLERVNKDLQEIKKETESLLKQQS